MIMYLQHFGLKHMPLGKHSPSVLESKQKEILTEHLNWLIGSNGIGLITGEAGVGKTTAIRDWTSSLNPLTHQVFYQSDNHFQMFDIYSQFADSLGLEYQHRYSNLWRNLKRELLHLSEEKKVTPIWILDEAQNLPLGFFENLPSFLNINFDTRDLMIILFVGTPKLYTILQRSHYAPIASRIQFHYEWLAIDSIKTFSNLLVEAFNKAGLTQSIISQSGMKLIHMASKGRLRYAHRLLTRCLQIAAQQKINHLPDDVINQAIESLRSMSH